MSNCSDEATAVPSPLRDIFGNSTNFAQLGSDRAKLVGWLRLRPQSAFSREPSPLSGLPTADFHGTSIVRHWGVFGSVPVAGQETTFSYWAGNDVLGGAVMPLRVMAVVVEANNADIRETEPRGNVVDHRDKYAMFHVEGYEVR